MNADGHPLMERMHRPGDEKRMLVLLRPADWPRWFQATTEQALQTIRSAPCGHLLGEPAPVRPQPQQTLDF